jgi:hypothetical protein
MLGLSTIFIHNLAKMSVEKPKVELDQSLEATRQEAQRVALELEKGVKEGEFNGSGDEIRWAEKKGEDQSDSVNWLLVLRGEEFKKELVLVLRREVLKLGEGDFLCVEHGYGKNGQMLFKTSDRVVRKKDEEGNLRTLEELELGNNTGDTLKLQFMDGKKASS